MSKSEERRATIAAFFAGLAPYWRTLYSATQGYVEWEYQTRGRIALEWLAALGQPPGRRLLDLGCGLGIQSAAAAQQGWRVVSVDFATALLECRKDRQRWASGNVPTKMISIQYPATSPASVPPTMRVTTRRRHTRSNNTITAAQSVAGKAKNQAKARP